MIETWRKVPGFDYVISIDGDEVRCKSLKTGVILSNKPNKKYGRIQWGFWKDGARYVQQAGRWVAITYPELIQNDYFDGAEIDHIDTNKLNDHPSNLRWVTRKENMNNQLTRKHLSEGLRGHHPTEETRKRLSDSHRGKRPWMLNKVGVRKVAQYTKDGVLVAEYPSLSQAQRDTGIQRVNIMNTCKNLRPSAGGYVWKYV